jgi:hypothetical protein
VKVAGGTRVEFEGLDSGPQALRAADLTLRSRLGGTQLAGFLGLDVLGGRRWVIDLTRRTIGVADGRPEAPASH